MTNYEFYLKCQEEGITNLKTNADKARIRLIAENNGIIAEQEECVEMFKLGKDDFLQQKSSEKKQAKQADIEEQRKKETEQISEAIKISELFGRDKPIYFCQKEINKLQSSIDENEKQINAIKNRTSSSVSAAKVKEQNWAVRGGIAQGLAGPAAGVATALETQQKNAQIRSYNDAMLTLAVKTEMQLTRKFYDEIRYLKDEIKTQEERIDNHNKRLVEELPEIELLEKLNPKIVGREITKTGMFKVTLQINAVEISIYDDVKATIDGTFKALFIDENNDIINEIYFTLPYNGSNKKHILTGYSSKSIGKDEKCKIVFIPINLWAVETDCDITDSSNQTTFQNKKEIAEYWKNDIINRRKNIHSDLKSKIDKMEKTKLPVDNLSLVLKYFFGIVGGIGILLSLYVRDFEMLLLEVCSCTPFFCVGFYRCDKFKREKMKERVKQIESLKKQVNIKEDLLNKKIKEIENILN